MGNAYIRDLQLAAARSRMVRETPLSLEQKIRAWHFSLPEFVRYRPFAMQELEKGTGSQGRFISPVLITLGWVRKRKWDSTGSYHRYWVPPKHS